MPRKYDCLIKFYSSWFADLKDESKAFSMEDIGIILMKIAEAQEHHNAELLNELPPLIKRGLQMATLIEQVTRIIERSESCRYRGAAGGRIARENRNEREWIAQQMQQSAREKEWQKTQENRKFYDRMAKSAGQDIVTWLRTTRTDEELLLMQKLDEPYREMKFHEWKKFRGFEK